MNEIVETNIENLIYEIRGKQVMLDSDLARLYGCKNGTKSINLAVKRNINKFPSRYMFQLTRDELKNFDSRFQIETLNNNRRGLNIKYLPYVFTEEGVAMLATVIRTTIAEEVSIRIMDAFVFMRKYISSNLIEQKYINDLVLKDNERINKLEELFSKLEQKEKINHLFFEGQIYDAYSLLVDILKTSEKEIILIDNYIDKTILDIISLLDKKVIIVTNKYNNMDIDKYKRQYNNLKIIINNKFHDRFIILDKKILYHCGASFKDIGVKCFSINKIEDKDYLNNLLERIKYE